MADAQDQTVKNLAPASSMQARRRFVTQGLAVSLLLTLPEIARAALSGGDARQIALAGQAGHMMPLPVHKPRAPRLVMLDAGHGGKDPGSIGRHGTYEKNVTLDITRRLADALGTMPGIEVKLTRSEDYFIPLSERVSMARDAKADLFISIHADSAPTPYAQGLSAYTLSEKASDSFAKAVATQENLADGPAGQIQDVDADVAAILNDLTQRRARNVSQRARAEIVDGVGRSKSWHLLQNPMRSANFAVLRAPDVPSVLIETGFLSNAKDEAQLALPENRHRIALLLSHEIDNVLSSSAFG